MMDWVFPENIIYLAALPLIWGLLLWVQYRSERVFGTWFRPSRIIGHAPILRFFLNAIGITLIAFSLLGPLWGDAKQGQTVMHREIFFVMDVSASMNANDLKPSRLEYVKKELKKLIPEFKGDKMGLILFTSNAYIQCPLTHDAQSLLLFLDMVETAQFASTGTDIRAALLKAHERFSADSVSAHKGAGKAVVLFTDGEHFGDNYTSVILRLRNQGVSIVPVGVGKSNPVSIPGKVDVNGIPLTTQTNYEHLSDMAATSGATLLTLKGEVGEWNLLSDALHKLPASKASDAALMHANRFQWFLFSGILLCFISLLLIPVKKK
jgi:Ca-activated chloride channel homolog